MFPKLKIKRRTSLKTKEKEGPIYSFITEDRPEVVDWSFSEYSTKKNYTKTSRSDKNGIKVDGCVNWHVSPH